MSTHHQPRPRAGRPAVAVKQAVKVRRCRVCGCTDRRACPGGCSWVEADLCSVCAGDVVIIVKEGHDVRR